MVTEEGVVIQVNRNSAWVKTVKTADCEACAAQGTCNVLGGSGKEMQVNAINEIGAKVDDRVVMSFGSASLLKASFLLYVAPIIGMIAGAVIGEKMAPSMNINPSTGSILLAFLIFAAMMIVIKFKGNKMAEKREYQPQIIRILKPLPDDNFQEKTVAD